MADRFPLLTKEWIDDTTDRLLKVGACMHDFARAIESATRAPLLAEIERLTRERDAALSALRRTIRTHLVDDEAWDHEAWDNEAETDRRVALALKEAANG